MNKIFIFFFIIFTQYLFSQTHAIEELVVNLSGNASVSDFSNNTYYHAYDSCDVSWTIINDSIPNGWLFSVCFPVCYSPGITSASQVFPSNSEQLLNCHIYPNNIPGSGVIYMEITTNGVQKDTVEWSATAINDLTLNEDSEIDNRKIINIYNLEGRKLSKAITNQVILIEFDDGLIEKRLILNKL